MFPKDGDLKSGFTILISIVENCYIFVKGKKCSWHYHKIKDEVFYVQSGKIIVYYSDGDDINKANVTILEPGDNFHVYTGLRHRMEALEDTELFEFSTQHFDSDSYRIEKGD